nr:uncharacterized protein LOC109738805 [Aegilops tauschii subsp. strangulata]
MEDKAAAEAEKKELTQWAEAAGEASSTGTGAPLIEDVVGESSSEEAVVVDPPATGRGRVLRRATSGEPVRPGRAAQPRQAQEISARQTRAAAAKKVVKAAVAKEKDIDTIIEDVAKAAEVEAEEIAAKEAAKGAADDAAKETAGEPGKGPAGEAGKSTAEEELEGLEKMLWEAKAREGTLTKNLETEKQLRKNKALNFKEHMEGENR